MFVEDSAGVEVHALVYLPPGFPEARSGHSPRRMSRPGTSDSPFSSSTPRSRGSPRRWTATASRLTWSRSPTASTSSGQPDGSITLPSRRTLPERPARRSWSATTTGARSRRLRDRGPPHRHRPPRLGPARRTGRASCSPMSPIWSPARPTRSSRRSTPTAIEVFRWSSAGLEDESCRAQTVGLGLRTRELGSGAWGRTATSWCRSGTSSSVYRIATVAARRLRRGQVIWKLGGRDSDFSFVDDPFGGPCAQHTAAVLPNGHVLLFDDGSGGGFAPALCVDQEDAGRRPAHSPAEPRRSSTRSTRRPTPRQMVWD